jgi:hypothetical protein
MTMSIAVILAISAVEKLWSIPETVDTVRSAVISTESECRMLDFMADVCIVSANRIGTVATRTFRMLI